MTPAEEAALFWSAASSIAAWAGTALALGALVLSTVNFVQARETAIVWRVVPPDVGSNLYRFQNSSPRKRALVIGFEVPAGGISNPPPMPMKVEPGNWVALIGHNLVNERLAVTLKWRQQSLGRWRRKVYSVTLFG